MMWKQFRDLSGLAFWVFKGWMVTVPALLVVDVAQAQLTADAGPDVTICSNGQTTLNGSATGGQTPYTYSWSPVAGLSNPNIPDPICTVNTTTTYTLTVTGQNGNTDTDQVTVNVNQAPVPQLSAAGPVQSTNFNSLTTFFVCGTNSFTFNFSNASTGAPNNATYNVNWGNGNTTNPPNGNWTSSQTYPLGITQGTYTITNPNGCSATLNFNVFVGDVPLGGAVPITGTTICTGQSITIEWNNFANNPPGTNYIVNWDDGSSDTLPHPPPTTISHTYTTSSCDQADGEFTVFWEIINPCDDRTGQFNQIRVSEEPQASFSQSADTVCINTTVTFTDTSTGAQAPQCATPNHVWSVTPATYTVASGTLGSINGSPNAPGLWTSGSQTLGLQFTAPGTYTITDVVGNNICGLDTLVRTVCVESPPVPSFTLSPLTGCSPLVVNTTNNSTVNGCLVTRTWEAAQLMQGCSPQPGSVNINTPQSAAPTFSFTGAGTYQVTLTLENSCGAFEQTVQPITVNVPPIVDIGPIPTICAGQATINPTATYQACGAPITAYAWSFPGGTPSSSNQQVPGAVAYTSADTYTITASATNACGTGNDQATVTVSTLPVANAGPDATICQGSSTQLIGSVTSGGTAPFTYNWSPATGLSATNVANPTATPGQTITYTLTVTDAGGCVGTDQVNVNVNVSATANAGGPYVTCDAQPVNIQATASGAGSWSAPSGAGAFGNATSASTTFTPASGTTDNITLTWTTNDPDGAGPCPVSISTAVVTVNIPATASVAGPFIVCGNGSVPVSATANGPGQWTSTNGGTFANPGSANTTFTPAAEGGSPVTITWTTNDPDGAGPCSAASAVTTITVNPSATANAGGPYFSCGTNAVNIQATASGPGTWSAPPGAGTFASATSTSTTFTPTSGSSSTITLTWTTVDPDANGPCQPVSANATLTVNAPATANVGGPYAVCSNASVPIVATTTNAGSWTTIGSGAFGNAGNASTTYTPGPGDTGGPVTITWTTVDPDGPNGPCLPATASTTVNVNTAPIVNAGADVTICAGSPAQLSASVSGGAPAYQYSWTPAAGLSASNTSNPSANPTGSTTYSVTVTDNNSCTDSDDVQVAVSPIATAVVDGPYTVCSNASVPIAATTNNPGSWTTTGSGSFGNAGNASTTYTPGPGDTGGTVTITWTTVDPDGPNGPCLPATDDATITVNPAPVVNAGSDVTICAGTPAQLNASVTSGTAPFTYSWSPSTGLSSANTSNPNANPAGTTTYSITVTDGNSCSDIDDVQVAVSAIATASVGGPYTVCSNSSVTVLATTNNNGTWTTSGSGTFGNVSNASTIYTPGPSDTGGPVTITWTTVDPDGPTGPCLPATDDGTVTVNPAPVIDAGADVTICAGSPAQLSASVSSGTPQFSYSWSPSAGLSSATVNNPDATPASTTTYTVTVTDGNSCVDTDDVQVAVNQAPIALAGGPYAVCGTNAVNINATTNGTGQWTSSGTGAFADASDPQTTYTPAAGEVGTVVLTWQTFDPDGTGPCFGADDTADLVITLPATAVPGGPYTICSSDVASIEVTTTPGGGTWSGGQGVFSDPTEASTTYEPGTVEAGTTVQLTWTTIDPDGPGPCLQVAATVDVNVLEAAVAAANGPYATCGESAVALAATTNGTGQWSSSGTGTFADASDPATTYTPDPSEVGSTITLTWETFDPDGTGPCPGADDSADLVITIPATAVPGGPYAICSNDIASIQVTTTPGDGTWSGGQGVFGDPTETSTTYEPGTAEAGTSVLLTWTTVDPDGPAPCPQVTATVEVNVLEAATAEANGPYATCATSSVVISATANGPGQWTVQPAGSGTFADNTATTTTFTPTVDPLVTTTVQVIWTTNDPDAAGPCPSATDAADLVINGLPVANAGPDVTIACGDTIDGSATLGTPAYAFVWSPANGVSNASAASTPVILSGTYQLLVTDANGCTDTDSVNVTVTGLENMALVADVETCLLVPVELAATAGQGIPTHTFSWSPTNLIQPATGQGPNVTFTYSNPLTQDSVFTLVLTVTDNLGCADTNQVLVTVHPLPVVYAGPDSSVCAYTPPYQLADFSPVAGPGTTGVWTPGQNVNPALLNIGNNTFTYTFTDLNGCVNDDDLVVTVNEVPVAALTMSDTLCVNTTFTPDNQTVCGTCSNVAYLWDFGDGSPLSTLFEPQHSYADTGTYVVTLIASSGFGCTDTITTVVEVIKIPELDFSFTPEVGCGPLLVDFTNNSLGLPINYLWTIETLGTSTAADPGNYAFPEAPCDSTYYTIQLTVSNLCGAVTSMDSVKVYRVPIPELAVSSDTICSGVELEAYNATTCAWQTTYTWDFGNNITSSSQDTTQSMVYTTFNDFATYVLTLSAANQCGTATDQQTITVVPNTIIAFFSADPISGCEPLPVQFTQQMAGVTFFTWDFGDGVSSNTQDPLHEYVSDGTYTVTFTAGNFCGALDTMSQVITVLPAPEFDITAEPNVLCVGEATAFSASGDPISGLAWSFGDGTGSSLLNPTHTYADSGLFVVSLSAISTLNGCPATATDTVQVLVTPDAQVTATPLSGCSPLEVTFLNTTTFASNFFWTFGDGNAFIGEQPQYVYTEPGTYTADLLATNSNGCADSASAIITVHPRPDAAFTYVTDPSPEATLPTQFENASTGAIAYQWDLGDGTESFLSNPMHTYALGLSCDFTPVLVAFNGFGCTDTARSTINIAYDLRIWAPNAFRPNGDGLNEEFVIVGADIEQSSVHLRIFNRWGELIHETKGREPRWDGRINGELAKNDVYVWTLSARTKCGFEDVDKIGHVTLIR